MNKVQETLSEMAKDLHAVGAIDKTTLLLDEPDIGMELAVKEISFLRAIIVEEASISCRMSLPLFNQV